MSQADLVVLPVRVELRKVAHDSSPKKFYGPGIAGAKTLKIENQGSGARQRFQMQIGNSEEFQATKAYFI